MLRSRKLLADEHGEWLPWLAENFDLSERTARNYMNAAEYVARKTKRRPNRQPLPIWPNLSPTVLYELAEGGYMEQEEAAILAATRKGRVDNDRAVDICKALNPPAPPGSDGENQEGDDADDNEDKTEDAAAEDAESAAILGGPPPAVPPPAPPVSTDYITPKFDELIEEFTQLITKPVASFERTMHAADKLKTVADFILAVRAQLQERCRARPGQQLATIVVTTRRPPWVRVTIIKNIREADELALAIAAELKTIFVD